MNGCTSVDNGTARSSRTMTNRAPARRCICGKASGIVKVPHQLDWFCLSCALMWWKSIAGRPLWEPPREVQS